MKMRATAWAVGMVLSFAAAASAGDLVTPSDPTVTPESGSGVVELEEVHIAPQPSAIVLGVVGGILVLIARRSMRRV